MNREGKFAKVKAQAIRFRIGDRITVDDKGEAVRAEVTEIADNEKGGTEVFWREL